MKNCWSKSVKASKKMQKLQFKNNMKILTNKAEEAIEDSVGNKIAEKIITMKSMTIE